MKLVYWLRCLFLIWCFLHSEEWIQAGYSLILIAVKAVSDTCNKRKPEAFFKTCALHTCLCLSECKQACLKDCDSAHAWTWLNDNKYLGAPANRCLCWDDPMPICHPHVNASMAMCAHISTCLHKCTFIYICWCKCTAVLFVETVLPMCGWTNMHFFLLHS